MFRVRVVRGTACLLMIGAVLCMSGASFATISFSNNTLTYSSPSDLSTTIDPTGQKEVATSYGVTKAAFQALNPQIVAFNGAPAPTQTLADAGRQLYGHRYRDVRLPIRLLQLRLV